MRGCIARSAFKGFEKRNHTFGQHQITARTCALCSNTDNENKQKLFANFEQEASAGVNNGCLSLLVKSSLNSPFGEEHTRAAPHATLEPVLED